MKLEKNCELQERDMKNQRSNLGTLNPRFDDYPTKANQWMSGKRNVGRLNLNEPQTDADET
jgi:hypothetical protein